MWNLVGLSLRLPVVSAGAPAHVTKPPRDEAGSWKLEVASWKLEAGSSKLEVGS